MLVVEVKNDNVEKAIRKLRKKVIQTKQLKNLKERKEYTKKSVKRRNEIQKASYIQKNMVTITNQHQKGVGLSPS